MSDDYKYLTHCKLLLYFLLQVIVEDMETRKAYEFPCNRWLAKDEDDGQTQRDLVCDVGPQDAPPGM